MRRIGTALALVGVLFGLTPAPAFADGPRVATDAFRFGARLGPQSALLAGWDLDVYLMRNRALSLGPAADVSVLGSEQFDGSDQDILLTVDALRLKVGLSEPGQDYRPHFIFGGGFYWSRLSAAVQEDVVVVAEDGSLATGSIPHPEEDSFGGLITVGIGVDWFAARHWGLNMQILTHFRVSGNDRLPDVWSSLSLGLRFGI